MTNPEVSSAFEGDHNFETGKRIEYVPAQDVDSGVMPEGAQIPVQSSEESSPMNETARRALREYFASFPSDEEPILD